MKVKVSVYYDILNIYLDMPDDIPEEDLEYELQNKIYDELEEEILDKARIDYFEIDKVYNKKGGEKLC